MIVKEDGGYCRPTEGEDEADEREDEADTCYAGQRCSAAEWEERKKKFTERLTPKDVQVWSSIGFRQWRLNNKN